MALYQRERHANPVVRSLKQSSDNVQRRNARTNLDVREHESEQRAAAREEPGVREQEQSADTMRRAIVRTDQGVREHESEQRAAAREELGVQEQEQSANTVRRAIVRTNQRVREHESEQRAAAREVRLKQCLLDEVTQSDDGSGVTNSGVHYYENLYMEIKTLWDLFNAGQFTTTVSCTACGTVSRTD